MRLNRVLRWHRSVDLWDFETYIIYKTIFRLYDETLTQKQTNKQTNKSMIRENYTQEAMTINMEIM
ncbi:rCG40800, partial [Rattus norvegicus]